MGHAIIIGPENIDDASLSICAWVGRDLLPHILEGESCKQPVMRSMTEITLGFFQNAELLGDLGLGSP